MPKKRKRKQMKKTVGIMGNKMFLAAIVGIIIIGGGIAAFYMMPGLFGGNDIATWDSASTIIADRERMSAPPPPPTTDPVTTTTDGEPVDEYLTTNPIQMSLFGIDIDGVRHAVPEPAPAAQSAYLGEVEIFDVEFDISWNFLMDINQYPERYASGDVEVMIMLSLVDRFVSDTHGNAYTDSYDSGAIYPADFTYNFTVLSADLLSQSVGTMTFSLIDDLYGAFAYTDINDIDAAALADSRTATLMNQVLEDDNVTITELTGMLTFEYGILGYYMVNELGSDANRALKRLTVTTDPVIPEEVGGMSVYDIGGYAISDSALLIVGLGVFSMIMVYYCLNRRR